MKVDRTNEMKVMLILLALCFAGGCSGTSARGKEEAQDRHVFEVIGIDISGSYREMTTKAVKIVEEMVAKAKPGDELFIRTISDQSYLPKNTVVYQRFKKLPPKPGRFDRMARYRYIKASKEFRAQKEKVIRALREMRFEPSPKTDILGFIQAASDLFALAPDGTRKVLAFATDLKDNVGFRVAPDLKGVEVIVFQFLTDADPSTTLKRRRRWVRMLKEWGAAEVRVYPAR